MEILHKSNFHKLEYTESQSLLESIWSFETEDMEPDEFQEQLKIYLKYLQETQAKNVIFNFQEFMFTIDPEIQVWVDTEITSIERQIVEKQVILMPENFISELGIEQTIEEENNQALNIEIFQTREEALKWFEI